MAQKRRHKRPKSRTEHQLLAQHLDELDWAIIDECIRNPAVTNLELGRQFKVQRRTIGNRRNRPRLQMEIADLKRDAIERTSGIIQKALSRAVQILQHGSDKDAKTIALKFINGLPEIATGVLKPEHDRSGEPTEDEITALAEFAEEITKRKAAESK